MLIGKNISEYLPIIVAKCSEVIKGNFNFCLKNLDTMNVFHDRSMLTKIIVYQT